MDNTYFRDFIDLAEAMNATGGADTVQRLLRPDRRGASSPAPGRCRLAALLTDPYQRLSGNLVEDIAWRASPACASSSRPMKSAYTGQAVEMPLSPATALGGLAGNIYGSPSEGARSPVAREVAGLSARTSMPWEPNNRPADVADAQVNPRTFTRGEQARGAEFAGSAPDRRGHPRGAGGVRRGDAGRPAAADHVPGVPGLAPGAEGGPHRGGHEGGVVGGHLRGDRGPGMQLKPEANSTGP